jgi:hypothetical protein
MRSIGIENSITRMIENANSREMRKQTILNIPTLSAEEKAKIDEKLALACYANGLPFTVYDSAEMRDAFKVVNPAYSPPTRKALAGTLLDRVHARVKAHIDDIISGLQHINIVTDESADINSTRIANISIHTSMGAIFWSSDDVGAIQMTADNLATWLRTKLLEISNNDLAKINSISTDTCPTMFVTWSLLSVMPDLKHCFFIPCDSHGISH